MCAQASRCKKNMFMAPRTVLSVLFLGLFIGSANAAGDDAARKAAANLAEADLHSFPLNEGNITTTGPRSTYVFVCTRGPLDEGRGGAQHAGHWIHDDGTFDASAKPQVEGNVEWPDHKLTISVQGDNRLIYT